MQVNHFSCKRAAKPERWDRRNPEISNQTELINGRLVHGRFMEALEGLKQTRYPLAI